MDFSVELFAAVGCGMLAGLFFAFSVFIMRALGKIKSAAGIAAMQSINIVILNPLFALLFFGTALASLYVVIRAIINWPEMNAAYLLSGGLLYLAGGILVTFVFNIPLNDKLAALDADDPTSEIFWQEYLSRWTAWNHLRTLSCVAATVLLIIGIEASTG